MVSPCTAPEVLETSLKSQDLYFHIMFCKHVVDYHRDLFHVLKPIRNCSSFCPWKSLFEIAGLRI